MTVSLTPEEAANHMRQVEEARDQALASLSKINDAQGNMLSSGWHGDSATKYGQTSDAQNDRFHHIVNTLNNVVELGSTHMKNITTNS